MLRFKIFVEYISLNQVVHFASEFEPYAFCFFFFKKLKKNVYRKMQIGTKRLGQCKEHSPASDLPTSKSCISLKKNSPSSMLPPLTGRAEVWPVPVSCSSP